MNLPLLTTVHSDYKLDYIRPLAGLVRNAERWLSGTWITHRRIRLMAEPIARGIQPDKYIQFITA